MQSKRYINIFFVVIALLSATTLSAQDTSTKNTYSLYSTYGLGEILSQGTLSTRSMGGAGVAARSGTSINLLNPASYSMAIQQGVLLDIGIEGSFITNSQKVDGGDVARSGYISGMVRNISLQIPLAKGFGMGLSIAPYSSVGYNINSYDTSFTDVGILAYNYQGDGDITEVKLGFGVRVAKGLSLGVSAQYYWGALDRYYSLAIIPISGSYVPSPAQGISTTYVSNVRAQFGLQWDAYMKDFTKLTFAATYDLGGNIAPADDLIVTSGSATDVAGLTSVDRIEYPALYLPHQVSLGATYRDRKWHAAADYSFQKWTGNHSMLTTNGVEVAYQNVSLIKLGLEYTPNRLDSRRYFRRAAYRAGLRAGNYYQTYGSEGVMQCAITAGVGLPMNMFAMSNIDVGVEYGYLGSLKSVSTGSNSMNLVRQNYFKVSVGVTLFGDDYWFQRVKYD